MKKNTFFLFVLFSFTSLLYQSCEESIMSSGRPIQLGDTSLIVTETDSNYLLNVVKDISINEQDVKEIARIMVQVDSVKIAEELDNFTSSDSVLKGFSIEFNDCKIIFQNLEAKALTEQNPKENRSVSYLVTKGNLAKMKIKVIGLTEASIKERIYTKLKVADQEKEYLLKSLGRKISDWFPLAGNENVFISAGDNSFQFNDLTNAKIKIALDKELRAKNIKEEKIQDWMRLIKNTSDYTDAPCKLYVSTAQFRLKGKTATGRVNKLIQLDIIE